MTTDNKTYFRLSALVINTGNVTEVVLEDIDGSKVHPHIQQAIGRMLQEQAEQREYVYITKTSKPEQQGYKVGRTKDLTRRERELGMQIVLTIPCDVWGDFSAIKLESMLHELYDLAGLRISKEWFDLNWWDMELLRVFFQEEMNFEEKKQCFLAFHLALKNLKVVYRTADNATLERLMETILKFWKENNEPYAGIHFTYLLRRLFIRKRIPESLFRYAIENVIYMEQKAWHQPHIHPIEKTFEQALVEYLNKELSAP